MTGEQIGIKLEGGPGILDGWLNLYDAEILGGWPPPNRIAAFQVRLLTKVTVGVARVGDVPLDIAEHVTFYRKIHQSDLDPPEPGDIIARGALYKVET